MTDALEQIDVNLSNSLVEKSSQLLKEIEQLNLHNKDKGMLENLIQAAEEKLGLAGKFVKEKVSEYGEAIVVLGTRKDESGSRAQLMNLYEIKGSLLSRHSKFAQAYVYTPLRDFITEDVWNYLLQNKNPWGANNRDLLALYQNANSSECPLVVDSSTPSCGNSRFGCWVCTVVAEDISLKNMIENGEDWMEPLLEFREELKQSQDPQKRREIRDFKRRTGQMKLVDDRMKKGLAEKAAESMNIPTDEFDKSDVYSQLVPGPYKLEYCKKLLSELLKSQKKVRKNGPDPNMDLIKEEELHEIQRIWRMERGDWKNSVYAIYEKVMGEFVLYLIFLGLGVLIGMNYQPKKPVSDENELPKEVKKLQQELQVMYNLKQSLLDDVSYWRNKANNNDIHRN